MNKEASESSVTNGDISSFSVIHKSKKKQKNKDKVKVKDSLADSPKLPTKTAVPSQDRSSQQNKNKAGGKGGGKLFEESEDWDSPLLPGEQEIVLPSKKYKGDIRLAPPAQSPLSDLSPKDKKKKKKKSEKTADVSPAKPTSSTSVSPAKESPEVKGSRNIVTPPAASPAAAPKGFPGFSGPTVSTPNLAKSHTAVFLKKALSKSVTPKMKHKAAGRSNAEVERSASEPRPKKVNFVLTRNISQVCIETGNCSTYFYTILFV